jgi:phosphoenolpyruvate-protein phosphotransferase (PTS system enzyme I)
MRIRYLEQRRVVKATVIVDGSVSGKAFVGPVSVQGDEEIGDTGLSADDEVARFEEEIANAIAELRDAMELLRRDGYVQEAEIVESHIAILRDPQLVEIVHERIRENHMAAESAVEHVISERSHLLERSGNELLSSRAIDIRDIGMRLRRRLRRESTEEFEDALREIASPVVFMRELLPTTVLEAFRLGAKAFVVERASRLSHAAILARTFGTPVYQVDSVGSLRATSGDTVLLDMSRALVIIHPAERDFERLRREEQVKPSAEFAHRLALDVYINIVGPEQIDGSLMTQIKGVGLYRTEFLFITEREDFPSEDEQYETYHRVFERAGDSIVTLRTLDIGGDRTPPYFSLGPRENPYLGLRAHRIFRFHPEIFTTQVRAALRAAGGKRPFRLMYPMVETVDELLWLQKLLHQAIESLGPEGRVNAALLHQGIMVEVPSMVWCLREALAHVEFCSVGTNDLLQYFFAVDRNNSNVSRAYRPESPSVLRMLRQISMVARSMNKPVGICGELAAVPGYLPVIVGLGYDNVSVTPHVVSKVIDVLGRFDIKECQALVERCIHSGTASVSRRAIEEFCRVHDYDSGFSIEPERQTEFVDPICGMRVDPRDEAVPSVRYQGHTYYFCSRACLRRFLESKDEGNSW